MAQCSHAPSSWTGIVTNQPERLRNGTPDDKSRPLSSRWVCSRQPCIDAAVRSCASDTNETATYVPKVEIKQRA
jgi:hypothetical protein